MTIMREILFLVLFFTATPPSRHQFVLAFKSNNNSRPSTDAHRYRRPRQGQGHGQSRSQASVYRESSWQLAAGDEGASAPTAIADDAERRFSAASTEKSEILVASGGEDDADAAVAATTTKAATSTVNERLLTEIQASVDTQKYGAGKRRQYFKEFQSQKTEEERQRSIEEAKDLNGVNPLVCIGGAVFAWACAGALWLVTTYLGVLFTSHPLDTDLYFAQRLADVFRNAIMGLVSLASGFFGVIGLGIFLLGLRVAYGVVTGELDPTPIKQPKSEEIVLPDVWGLMMGKKPSRRGNRGGGDDNFFGS